MQDSTKRRLAARIVLGLGLALAGCAEAGPTAPGQVRTVAIRSTDARPNHVDRTHWSPSRNVELIDQDATLVQHQLIRARALREEARAACLDDKLSQLHADGRNAAQQAEGLKHALAANDARGQRQHGVMLDVLRREAQDLTQQADRCGAQPTGGGAGAWLRAERDATR